MGMVSRLYGYIEEAWPGANAGGDSKKMQLLVDQSRRIERHNEAILQALPIIDEWPPISRHMFAYAPPDVQMITYKNRLIHFAASLKEVDGDIGQWIEKFEHLLRSLYWESAVVHFEAAYEGEHRFEWHPKDEWVSRLCNGFLEPVLQWDRTSTMSEDELAERRWGTS